MTQFPVMVEFPVRWGEMDALGHVNNSVFFRWFESARIAFFDRTGFPTLNDGDLAPILARTTCEFLVPIVYPADVRVSTGVSRMGTSSLTMEYRVDLEGTTLVARGEAVVVLVDTQTGKSHPIPEPVRERIEALKSES